MFPAEGNEMNTNRHTEIAQQALRRASGKGAALREKRELPSDGARSAFYATGKGGGTDDFHQAVDLLRKCVADASPRHDDAFLTDVREALKLLEKWTDDGKRTEARTIQQRQGHIRELRRRR